MTDINAIPEIRFKGFSDTWEQRKLRELCNITTGKLDANAMVSDGQYDFYTSGIDVFKIDVAAFEGPAITIAGNGASVGYMHLADGKFNAYQRTYVLTDFLADRQFLNVAIGNELPNKIQEEVRGSGIPYIVLNMLTDLAIPFPSHEEQYAIGVYFQQLDTLITLHQRKLGKITKIKMAMLEKMFPKNGSDVPEIRFKGFTDAWEQRKLGEIVTEVKRTDENSSAPVMMITANDGFINQSDRYSTNNAGQSLKKYILLEKGELAYNHGASKLRPYGSCFALTMEEKARIPFVYHCFSANEDNPEFLSIVLNGKNVERQLRRIVSSGARMDGLLNISFEEYTSIPILIPGRSEQNKIADYFRNLDTLITLHQRELEKLQNIKKSMLEKMFPTSKSKEM